jgi:hypothetical protein
VDRPAGDPHAGDSTSVNDTSTKQDDMDAMPAGDQGG